MHLKHDNSPRLAQAERQGRTGEMGRAFSCLSCIFIVCSTFSSWIFVITIGYFVPWHLSYVAYTSYD